MSSINRASREIAEGAFSHESERAAYVDGVNAGYRSKSSTPPHRLEPREDGEPSPAAAWGKGFEYGQRLASGEAEQDYVFPETETCGTLLPLGDTVHPDIVDSMENQGRLDTREVV